MKFHLIGYVVRLSRCKAMYIFLLSYTKTISSLMLHSNDNVDTSKFVIMVTKIIKMIIIKMMMMIMIKFVFCKAKIATNVHQNKPPVWV